MNTTWGPRRSPQSVRSGTQNVLGVVFECFTGSDHVFSRLFDLTGLNKRFRRLVADTIEDKRAPDLISAALRHGILDPGNAQVALKTSERTSRNTLKQLTIAGYLISASPKTPVCLPFPWTIGNGSFQICLRISNRLLNLENDPAG